MNMKKLITTAFLMTLVSASYGQDVETIPASTFFADGVKTRVAITAEDLSLNTNREWYSEIINSEELPTSPIRHHPTY